jgi:hypothetical protein
MRFFPFYIENHGQTFQQNSKNMKNVSASCIPESCKNRTFSVADTEHATAKETCTVELQYRQKKRGISLKECSGCSFFIKTDEILFNGPLLCLQYFKDKFFGSFFINTKMPTNPVSLVKNYVF